MKIAIIGAGNLGISIAKGILKNSIASSLYLTKRHVDSLEAFNVEEFVVITKDNKLAIENSDVVIFAVQPNHLEAIFIENKPFFKDKHILISTVTGFSIQNITEILGSSNGVVRAMPNTAIAVGKSMTCISTMDGEHTKLKSAVKIFSVLGQVLVIPEHLMQAATVVCASGIAFWMRMIRASTQAAIQLGFDAKEAQQLAMYTAEGAAHLLIATGNHPEEEIDKVTTPKGCTIEGLNEMEHQGLSSSVIKGMMASYHKIDGIKDMP
ncbi:pyrroline-5-carboxylate reductase [Winogradskyella maritima]|uniref:Pyrroline-5-carboxylate reductase n=1 Tax=Winogradskyella maritima TaxID=1517766 RepID=A0ABV8AFT5_9FLAO|nr:pyrroline-5-carboxylate reductase [Winogradskyella maritima]